MVKQHIDQEKVKATLKAVRKELDLTQVEFASLIDTPVATLRDWEKTGKATGAALVLVNMIDHQIKQARKKYWTKPSATRDLEHNKAIEKLIDDLEASKSFKVDVELKHEFNNVYYPHVKVTTLAGTTDLSECADEGQEIFIGDGIDDEYGEIVVNEEGVQFNYPYLTEGTIDGSSWILDELIHDEIKRKIGELAWAEYERIDAE